VDHVNEKLPLVQLRFGQNLIDLLPLSPHSPAPSPDAGMDHLCLSIHCDDLDKVAAALRARGVTVEGEVVTRRGAFGDGPSLYLRDPDGYRIELKPR
jgi:catechol 2,3-dioxygenase-like lactoylglutathione lyase family enzyme